MHEDDDPTPPASEHASWAIVIRGGEPVPAFLVDAALRAHVLLAETTLDEVVALSVRIRPVAVLVPEAIFEGHRALIDDLCGAVDARLVVLPTKGFDPNLLLAELRRAAERREAT